MNWYIFFKDEILGRLPKEINLQESDFKEGDFGDLKRIEMSYLSKLIDIDFWSNGTVEISAVDTALDEGYEILQALYFPDDKNEEIQNSFFSLIEIVRSD